MITRTYTHIKGKISTFSTFNCFSERGITAHLIMKDGRSFMFKCDKFSVFHAMRLEFDLLPRDGVRRVITADYPAKNRLQRYKAPATKAAPVC